MNFLQSYAEKFDQLGPLVVKGAEKADVYACEIIDLLKDIRTNTDNLYGVDVYEYPRLPFGAAGEKFVEGREGYVKIVKQLAIVAPAAVDVDLFVQERGDAGFLWRESFTAAGRRSVKTDLPIPEAQGVYVVTSAAAQVNMVIRRIKL